MSETMVSSTQANVQSKASARKRPGPKVALLIALALFVVGTFSNVLIQTGFGSVKIEQVKLVDPVTKASINTVLYAPENATAETPAPVVITMHGGSQNLAQQQFLSLEYARRGYIVLAVDFQGSGETEANTDRNSVTNAAISFLQGLDFAIPDQIITVGHSMGGQAAFTAGQNHSDVVKLVIAVGMNTGETELPTNYAYILGKNDASALVRTNGQVRDIVDTDSYRQLFNTTEDIVIGQEYGNWADGTGRIYLVSNSRHTWEPFDSLTINYCLDVSNRVVPSPIQISSDNQIWLWSALANGLAFAAVFVFMFGFAAALLRTKFFGALMLPVRKPVGFKTGSKPWLFCLALIAVIPPVLYCLLSSVMETHSISWMAMNSTVDGIVHWHWAIAALYIVLFVVFHFVHGKKAGGSLMTYGYATYENGNKVSVLYILRALLMAVCVIGATYLISYIYYTLNCHGIHFFKWGTNVLPTGKLSTYLLYFILELPYFIMVGLASRSLSINNGYRKDGSGMKNSVLLSLAMSTIGLIVMLIIFDITVQTTGHVLFTANRGYIFFTGLFGTLPYLALCGLINCFITNKTNSVYAGVFSAALLSAWSLVGGFPMSAIM